MASFNERVWRITKQIPRGKVSTYKEIAHALHCKAYRAVGQALNKNPYAPHVPCHRVVASDGSLGGFAHGSKQKIRLLLVEGISVKNNKIVNFEQCFKKLKKIVRNK